VTNALVDPVLQPNVPEPGSDSLTKFRQSGADPYDFDQTPTMGDASAALLPK